MKKDKRLVRQYEYHDRYVRKMKAVGMQQAMIWIPASKVNQVKAFAESLLTTEQRAVK